VTGRRKILALSLGCPAGVGPQVAVAAATRLAEHERPDRAQALLIGDRAVIERACAASAGARSLHVVTSRQGLDDLPDGAIAVWGPSSALGAPLAPGTPDAAAGRAQLAWVNEACDLAASGLADAMVTGPVSKHAIASSGARGARSFLGHTEHLARRLGAPEVVMAFWSPQLVTALVTTHLRLADVPRAIKKKGVASSAYWLTRLLIALGCAQPRVAVAALNPHAGEGGLLGDEEGRAIAPGILRARERLAVEGLAATLVGPLGAETAYRRAIAGPHRAYDGVVAMYHDQATIPSKVLAFGEAVNVTLGLPIIRTSVDHGTGYDVAWTSAVDPRGMIEAVDLAARLAVARG
jgi:4-hydroxythreonine-4-phosphate dehydrogenase